MRRPLALVGFTYLLALVAAVYFGESAAAVLAVLSFVLFCVSMCYRPARRAKYFPVAFFTAAVAFVSYGVAMQTQVRPVQQLAESDAVISGVICELPYEDYNRYYYTIETDSVTPTEDYPGMPVPQKMKVRISTSHALSADVYDRVEGKVHFFLPADEQGFSSRTYYASKGFYQLAFLYEYEDVSITPGQSRPFYYYALKTRGSMLAALRTLLPPEQSALAGGAFLGERHAIDDATQADFRDCGVSHLLAVSGLHLTLLAWMFLTLLRFFRLPEKLSILLCSVAILGFMAVTGFTPSIVRAGVMNILYLLSRLFSRQPDSLNSLGLAVLLLTLPNPFAAGDVGLLLSFSASLGLILLSERMSGWLGAKIRRLRFGQKPLLAANSIFSATMSATLFTLPVLILTFGRVSLIAPLANLLLVPPAEAMLLCAALCTLLSFTGVLSFLAYPFALGTGVLCRYLTGCASLLADVPYASLSTEQGFWSIWMAASLVLAAIAVLIYQKRRFPVRLCALLSAFLLLVGVFSHQLARRGTIELAVLNTETDGYSVVLYQEGRAALLACTGEGMTASQTDAFLRSRNVTQLDLALLPEQSGQTSAGAGELIRTYRPQLALFPDDARIDNRLQNDIRQAVRTQKYASEIKSELWDGVTVETHQTGQDSWCVVTVRGLRFLFCFGETEPSRLPRADRQSHVWITGKEISKAGMPEGTFLVCLEGEEEEETPLILPEFVGGAALVEQRGNICFEIAEDAAVTVRRE